MAYTIIEPVTEAVQVVFERVFREYGLPRVLRTDNGAPFASSGAAGLTWLAVARIKLGIRLERFDPGAPQQNGRHERMHGSLQRETASPPTASPAEQQARFDEFRERYNHERPHEALGQQVPAGHYQPSPRPYPAFIEEPRYDAEHAVRRVRSNGEIKWGGDLVFISEALVGEPVGVCETSSSRIRAAPCSIDRIMYVWHVALCPLLPRAQRQPRCQHDYHKAQSLRRHDAEVVSA